MEFDQNQFYYFYILQSLVEPSYFYKGSTVNLTTRLQQHNSGQVQSTKPRKPYKIVYFEAYCSKAAARKRESAVKRSGSISVPLLRRVRDSFQ